MIPVNDRIIIKPFPSKGKTDGGILIPDNAKEKPNEGTVIAVGKGKPNHQMSLKIGETVLFNRHAGTKFYHNEVDYIVIREEKIIAVL